ncbi:MAG: hypothetical protein AAF569_05465 [Pseudomonadota bacterium]
MSKVSWFRRNADWILATPVCLGVACVAVDFVAGKNESPLNVDISFLSEAPPVATIYNHRAQLMDSGMTEREAEVEIVRHLSDPELADLPNDVLADFIDSIVGRSHFPLFSMASGQDLVKNPEELERLYTEFSNDPSLTYWMNRVSVQLMDQLSSDPVLYDARMRWHLEEGEEGFLTLDDRLDILNHVSALVVSTFQANLSDHNLSPDVTIELSSFKDSNDNLVTHGDYNRFSGKILISEDTLFQIFSRPLEVVIHETVHHVQKELGRMVREAEIEFDSPFYAISVIYERNLNWGGYLNSDQHGFEAYQANVVEQHSRDLESLAIYAGLFDGADNAFSTELGQVLTISYEIVRGTLSSDNEQYEQFIDVMHGVFDETLPTLSGEDMNRALLVRRKIFPDFGLF